MFFGGGSSGVHRTPLKHSRYVLLSSCGIARLKVWRPVWRLSAPDAPRCPTMPSRCPPNCSADAPPMPSVWERVAPLCGIHSYTFNRVRVGLSAAGGCVHGSDGRRVGSKGQSAGRSVGGSGRSVRQGLGGRVGRPVGRSTGRSVGRSAGRSVDQSAVRSAVRAGR